MVVEGGVCGDSSEWTRLDRKETEIVYEEKDAEVAVQKGREDGDGEIGEGN